MNIEPRQIHRIAFFAPANFEYTPRLAEGLLRYQAERGQCVVRDFRYDSAAPEDREAWAKHPWPWREWKPHGLVVNVSADPGLAEWVSASGLPAINTARTSTHLPAVHISSDGVARLAIEHLRSRGFHSFAYVASDPVDTRAAAFETRLRAMGLPIAMINYGMNPAYWDDAIESDRAGSPALRHLLERTPKPMAILAADDNIGRVVCRAALQMGFRIPWDIGVLGVNNFSVCKSCEPPLSSIHAPGAEVGFRAMGLLMRMIHGVPVPHRTEIEPGIVYARESTVGRVDKEADLSRAISLIRERAGEGMRVNDVLEEVQMSATTMYREFRSRLGHTAAEEIARLRLERAKEMLGNTKMPIGRIGLMLGYPTAANFTTFFKNRTGMTPRAFRKTGGKSEG